MSVIEDFGNPPTKDQGYKIQAVANPGCKLDVVGEYYRQKSVESACDRSGGYAWAVLRPEPENKHDSNAVAVHVKGTKIGFIASEVAAMIQPSLIKAQAFDRKRIACPAVFDDPGNDTIQVRLIVDASALVLTERKSINWQLWRDLLKWAVYVAFLGIVIVLLLTGLGWIYSGVAYVLREIMSFFRIMF